MMIFSSRHWIDWIKRAISCCVAFSFMLWSAIVIMARWINRVMMKVKNTKRDGYSGPHPRAHGLNEPELGNIHASRLVYGGVKYERARRPRSHTSDHFQESSKIPNNYGVHSSVIQNTIWKVLQWDTWGTVTTVTKAESTTSPTLTPKPAHITRPISLLRLPSVPYIFDGQLLGCVDCSSLPKKDEIDRVPRPFLNVQVKLWNVCPKTLKSVESSK